MMPDQRLAHLAAELEAAGLESLVMGGHAVRYYGIDRNTADYDFCVAAASVREVRERLARIPSLTSARPGPSWRPNDFARFEVGRLPDGREEWLEMWLHNHLLAPFLSLRARQERGSYGGREVSFISLPDLLRSKETEREGDWLDISLLEEIQDARHLVAVTTKAGHENFLSHLRSRRGFDRALAMGLFDDRARIEAAVANCEHPVAYAWLLPLVPDAPKPPRLIQDIDSIYLTPLRSVAFAGPKHVALVEVVRRAYKRWAIEMDRRDKQSRLAAP